MGDDNGEDQNQQLTDLKVFILLICFSGKQRKVITSSLYFLNNKSLIFNF